MEKNFLTSISYSLKKILGIIPLFVFVASLALTIPVSAAVQDSDMDGLTDQGEKNIYGTNPLLRDTDGDGVGDGAEIINKTDPLDPADSVLAKSDKTTEADSIFGDPKKFAWYFARASGIAAFILLTVVVISGLIISSRVLMFFRVIHPANSMEIHQTLSWLALSLVILHFSSLLFDNFLRLRISDVLVPFALDRNLKTNLGFDLGNTMALGIIAFYLLLMLVLSSHFRAKIPFKLWRGLHYFSFLAYVLFVLHGWTSGTDSKEWWMQAIYSISILAVFSALLVRLMFRNFIPWLAERLPKA